MFPVPELLDFLDEEEDFAFMLWGLGLRVSLLDQPSLGVC
jgi:hypothetical protein